jgi:WD40 repeat protein
MTPDSDMPTLPPSAPQGADDATLSGVRAAAGSDITAAPLPRGGEAASAAAAAAAPPGYVIERELGRGGMGVVYLARQIGLNRPVALKMVLSGGHAGAAELVRFLAEAEAIAQLRHPNVVQIHEVGSHAGQPYFTLEFCEGGGLDGKLGGNPLPAGEAATVGEAVARGVGAAHQLGIIHRDLKPHNVLLAADGTPKVTDFGLAKRVGSGSDLTQTGAVMGTPSYMAPEQAEGKGKEVGPAADVYALGAVLYELLTGRPPFKAATPLDTLLLAISNDPVPPRQLNPQVPADLETIALKCLHKDPARRYPTANELADDLARYRAGEPITARPAGPVERAWKWVRRHKAIAGTVAAVAAALLLGAGVSAWQAVRASGEAERAGRAEKDATDRANAEATAKREAEAARTQADADRRRAVAAEEDAIDQVYATSIDLAHREWEQNNLYRAEQLLNETPARLRGWEWHHLRSLTRLEERTLRGHLGGVLELTVSPDGSRVMSVDQTGELKVWELATGRELLTTNAAAEPLLFSPDGTLALVTTAYRVRLAETTNGNEVLGLPLQRLNAAVFLDGGKKLLTVDQFGGQVSEWDTATGKKLTDRAAVIPAAGLSQLSRFATRLSPDGTRAAFGTNGGVTRVIDLNTGKTLHELQGPPMHVCGIAFHPKGKLLAVGAPNGTVQLWDLEAKKEVRRLRAHASSVDALAFSPNGRQLASGGQDMAARVWDVDTGTEVRTLRGHTSNVWCVAFTPDGKRLVTGSPDRSVRVWDLADTRHSGALRGLIGLSVSAKGGGDLNTLISVAAGSHHTYYGHGGPTRFVAVSPDGTKAATTNNGDGAVAVWDLDTHKQLHTLVFPKGCRGSVAFDPSGKRLALAYRGQEAGVRVWQLGKADPTFSADVTAPEGDETVVAFSPEGESVLGCWPADRASPVRVWDLTDKKEAEPLPLDGVRVNTLAFTPDGRSLVVGANTSLLVYDWSGRRLLRSGAVPYSEGIAIGRHGQAACGGADGVIRLYDLTTMRAVRQLEGHVGRLWAVAFSPDGSRLVSAGNEMTVKLWNTRTGRELLTFRDHVREVSDVAWSGDGRRIASCGWDGMLKVWSIPAESRDSTDRWTELFVADFEKPDALSGWKKVENWAVENGAAKGTLVATPLPGGGSTFPMAQLFPPVPPLPSTVELRYTVWAPKPAVAEGTFVHPTAGLSLHTVLGSDPKSGGAGPRIPGAFVMTMRGGATSEVLGVPRTKFKFEPDRKYHFRVLREKTRLTVWVDGEYVLSQDVPAGEAPALMLAGSWGELGEVIYFDDVRVRAPEAAVHERRLLDRLDGWFAAYLLRAAVIEQVDAAADLSDADRRFLRARASTLVEDPRQIAEAAVKTVSRADATPAEYAIALRQGEACARLQPQGTEGLGVRGLAEMRAGQLDAAAATLHEVIDRRERESGSAGPIAAAALALVRHRQGKADEGRDLARRAKDMLHGERWAADPLAVSLTAEAEKAVGLPDDAGRDAICRAVFGADQRGWNHADLPAYLASYAADARVTHGRGPRPGEHDVTFDRSALAGFTRTVAPLWAQDGYRSTYHDVSVTRTGDTAELKYTKTDSTGEFFVTWSAVGTVRRIGNTWVIAEIRRWPVRMRRGGWRREFDAEGFRELDAAVDAARKEKDGGKLVAAMIAARQFGAALTAARDLTRKPEAKAADWLLLAEAALETATTDTMNEAIRTAFARDPLLTHPWFLSRQQKSHHPKAGQLFALARYPDTAGVVVAGADRKVHWFDPIAGKVLRSTNADHLNAVSDAQYSPDGKSVASVAIDGRLYLWAVDTGQWWWFTAAHAGHAYRLAFRPDGTQIATCGDDRMVRVWDKASGKPVRELAGHTGPVYGVAWSPDGKRIASASTDGSVRVWNADTGKELFALRPPPKTVWQAYRVAFSPDGKQIAASGSDGTIRVWDADTREPIHTLSGVHQRVVEPILFSPDGKSLVSGGHDAQVVWWDLTTGKPREVLRGHADGVFALCWGATAEELVSASADGTVRVWTLKAW